MTISVKIANVVSPFRRMAIGGAAYPVKAVKIMAGGTLQLAASFADSPGGGESGGTPAPSGLTATPDPASVSGEGFGSKPSNVVSDPATVTPAGGNAPYSYQWSMLTGNTGIAITAPTMATTAFRRVLFGNSVNATAQCVVTDAFGLTATCTVDVTLTQENS